MESEDMIREILLRLPWRSVARFKSVSKGWHRLISNPTFVSNHHATSYPFLGFFYLDTELSKVKFSLSSSQDNLDLQKLIGEIQYCPNHSTYVLSSSNGLLLFYNHSLYVVRNPFTNQELRLRPPLPEIEREFMVQGFAFNHYASPPHFILTEPSGILVYDIKREKFSTLTVEDEDIDEKKNRCIGCSRLYCPRSLGESQGRLLYIRVPGDCKLCSWILEDYERCKWSQLYQIVINNSSAPLLKEVTVEFDPRDSKVVNLYFKENVFSYHLESEELKEIFRVGVELHEECNNIHFLCPYNLPRSPHWIATEIFGNSSLLEGTVMADPTATNSTDDGGTNTSATNPMAGRQEHHPTYGCLMKGS